MERRLASSLDQLREHYDAVVIGSGYGASVAALRLAQTGRRVAVMERGSERRPGEYPDTTDEALAQIRMRGAGVDVGRSDALFDVLIGDDIHVVTGSGLGGTSQINASVALEPTDAVLDDAAFPAALRNDRAFLRRGFALARQMLDAQPDPLPRAKSAALNRIGAALGAPAVTPPLAVSFRPGGINAHGVRQAPCSGCGDCVTGCNEGAKNTLIMNYLPAAAAAGAQLFCGVQVTRIARGPEGWLVFYALASTQGPDAPFGAQEAAVRASAVFLGAGSLGSTEILLRSRDNGLPLSPCLGTRFSGNGDVLAFSYNGAHRVNGVGRVPTTEPAPGPCISTALDLRERTGVNAIIEEGVLPGALASLYGTVFAGNAAMLGERATGDLQEEAARMRRAVQTAVRGAYHGAMQNTLTFLVMSHDDAGGEISLDGDRLRVRWPGVGDLPGIHAVDRLLQQGSDALSGDFLRNPAWSAALGRRLVTVHPLGGCPMGEDGLAGVVDDLGQVFTGERPEAKHEGLYVLDGSVLPRSVGVNPLLTITAVAERALERIAPLLPGPTPDPGVPAPADAIAAGRPPGIRFTERMAGHIGASGASAEEAAQIAEAAGQPAHFVLTITVDSLAAFLGDPRHRASLHGSVLFSALGPKPMQVHGGVFELLSLAADRPETREMRYGFELHSPSGVRLHVLGVKRIHDDGGADLWSDTTTLTVTVARDPELNDVVARGILTIAPGDFVRQLATIEALAPATKAEALGAIARFGEFFVGSLYQIYGSVLRGLTPFDQNAGPRRRRALRVPVPTVHRVSAGNANLRLTRFRGGSKGPVLLLHGLGVSSRIFLVDTIETNLVEYLVANGYDCFVADFRVSIELPSAHEASDGDLIAATDHPVLVEAVRDISAKPTVQVIAHCYGATTFTMALLKGLPGVGAVVLSQIAADVVTPPEAALKAGLFLPDVLDAVGIGSMTAVPALSSPPLEKLFDRALGVINHARIAGRCSNPVCHRVQFMYSTLYEHERLNAATHDAMHELFGVANMATFKHLALMIRRGELVTATGAGSYLDSLEGLNRPIRFIHGERNACYLPESTARTLQRLETAFGAGLFSRRVVPGYGHLDCIFGSDAVVDVYPLILEHLEAHPS